MPGDYNTLLQYLSASGLLTEDAMEKLSGAALTEEVVDLAISAHALFCTKLHTGQGEDRCSFDFESFRLLRVPITADQKLWTDWVTVANQRLPFVQLRRVLVSVNTVLGDIAAAGDLDLADEIARLIPPAADVRRLLTARSRAKLLPRQVDSSTPS